MELPGLRLFLPKPKPLAADLVVFFVCFLFFFFCWAEELSFILEQTTLVCHASAGLWWCGRSAFLGGEDIIFCLKILHPASARGERDTLGADKARCDEVDSSALSQTLPGP